MKDFSICKTTVSAVDNSRRMALMEVSPLTPTISSPISISLSASALWGSFSETISRESSMESTIPNPNFSSRDRFESRTQKDFGGSVGAVGIRGSSSQRVMAILGFVDIKLRRKSTVLLINPK